MSRTLHFQQIHVTRSPGMPGGLPELRELSPNINIIHGPNASGKSSLARAIQEMVWGDTGAAAGRGGRSGDARGSGDAGKPGNANRKGNESKPGNANHAPATLTARADFRIFSENSNEASKMDGKEASTGHGITPETWTVTIQDNNRILRRNGHQQPLQNLPASAASSHYMLSLQDLIIAEGNSLAAQIRREAIGGYDLTAIPGNLGYKDKLSSANLGEARDAKKAIKQLKEAISEQKKLQQQQQSLAELERKKERSVLARELVSILDKVMQIFARNQQKSDDQKRIQEYPNALKHLRDEDEQRFATLTGDLATHQKDLHTEQDNLRAAERKLQTLGFTENGPDPQALLQLEATTATIRKISDQISAAEQDCHRLHAEAADLTDLFERNSPDWNEALPNLAERTALDSTWRAISEKTNLIHWETEKKEAFKEKLRHISQFRPGSQSSHTSESQTLESQTPEAITQGIQALSQWLSAVRTEEPESRFSSRVDGIRTTGRIAGRWASLLTVVLLLTVILTYLQGAVGFLGLAPAAFLAWKLFQSLQSFQTEAAGQNPDEEIEQIRSIRKKDFEDTGLRPPDSWQTGAVSKRLHQLLQDREQAEQLVSCKEELHQTEKRIEKLQSELMPLEEAIGTLRETLAGQLYFENYDFASPTALYDITKTIQRWQEKRSQYRGAVEKTGKLRETFESAAKTFEEQWRECLGGEELEKVADSTGSVDSTNSVDTIGSVDSTGGNQSTSIVDSRQRADWFQAKFKTLQQRHQAYVSAKHEQTLISGTITGLQKEITNTQQEIGRMAKRLETEALSADQLQGWMKMLPEYQELAKQIHNHQTEIKILTGQAREQVEWHEERHAERQEKHPEWRSVEDWLALDEQELQAALEQEMQTAAELEDVSDRIVRIQEQIKRAGESSALQELVQKKNDALASLEEKFESDLRSIAGDTLVKLLRKQLASVEMPPVFERAKELFSLVTMGRYELRVEMSGEGAFYAIDRRDQTEKQIEELSTGTKIQLMMAVRLAFIEESEQGVMLPILADELLANSDDERSAAMIGALCEISRAGRQVFYFTAQEDEVQRWEEWVSSHGKARDGMRDGVPNLLHIKKVTFPGLNA